LINLITTIPPFLLATSNQTFFPDFTASKGALNTSELSGKGRMSLLPSNFLIIGSIVFLNYEMDVFAILAQIRWSRN
jgi:hypothetical protein